MKKLQLTFNKKYVTSTRIGIGKTSETYIGYELSTQKQLAIKLQQIGEGQGELQRQAKFYKIVKGGQGIPILYWYGIQNNLRVLVTDIYGPSLQQLLTFCKNTFSLKTTLLVADQIFQRIHWIHSKGLIYNDIQPENFLVGLGQQQDKIFLIDFGNCKKYVDPEGNHVKYDQQTNIFNSSLRFKSIGAHIGKKTGRRDDLESIGYMLVYFMKGKLPWDDLLKQEENASLIIKERKSSVPIELLTQGLPQQFASYFEYVKTLEYQQQPDYGWIRRCFKDLFDSKGFVNNRVMDWAERHTY